MKKLIIIISMLFSVAYGQTCDTVTNLTFSLVTTSTARVTWTHATNKISYNWALYCLSGCGGIAQQSGNTAGNTLNLSGLNSSFAYQFCITTYCGATSSTPKCSNFTTLSPQIQYTPMTAAGYQFKYVKVDTGFNIPLLDTSIRRGINQAGAMVCLPSNKKFYGYNGSYWELIQGVNSAANKVDSVIINSAGDSLFYWINGTSYGQVFGGASSRWSILGNSGTNPTTNFIGTTDSVRLDLRTNNTIRQSITGSGNVGIGTVTPISKFQVNGTIRGTDSLILSGLGYGVGTQSLRRNGVTGAITWADTTAGGGGGTPTLTATEIAYGNGSNLMTSSPFFTYDTNGGGVFNVGFGGNDYLTLDVPTKLYRFGDVGDANNGNKTVVDEANNLAYYKNIANTGKFGINTSTPSVALDVVGAIKATDSISFTGLLPMSAGTDSVVVRDTNGKLGTTGSVVTINGTQTLTNKRWTARVGSTTSSATPTINTDNTDIYKLTAQSADITSFTTNLSGTPVDGDILEIQVTGTAARAITWGASFVSSTVALPTTTATTATLTIIFQYYTTSSYGNNKWICVNYY